MGMFDFLTAPAASIGSSIIGGLFGQSGQASANAANQAQFDKQIELANTAHQREVADLKAAGLNPMLSVSKGGGGSSVPNAPVMQNTKGQLGQALMNSAQVGLMNAQTRKANAEANVTEQVGLEQAKADLQRTLASTGLTSAQIAQVTANTDNLVAQLANIKDENLKIKRAAELIYQQTNESVQRQLTEAQRYELTKAQVQQVIAATSLSNLDIQAAKALDNLGRTSAQLKPVIDMFRLLMRR